MKLEKVENDVEINANDGEKGKNTKRFTAIALAIYTALYLYTFRGAIKNSLPFDAYVDKEKKLTELQDRLGITIDPEVDDNLLILYYGFTNKNLNSEEKEGFIYLIDLLRDNPYVNVNLSSRAIANLDVEYRNKFLEKETLAANYRPISNTVRMYLDSSMSDTVYVHELIHAIFHQGKAASLPKFMTEGMTELLTNEYCEYDWYNELYSYVYETVMIKVLCEMTSSDTVLKTYTLGDMKYLTDDLNKYFTEEETKRFIKLTTDIFNITDYDVAVPQKDLDELLQLSDKYMKIKYPEQENVKKRYSYYRGILENMSHEKPYYDGVIYICEHEPPIYPYFSSYLKRKYIDTIEENKNEDKPKELKLTNN